MKTKYTAVFVLSCLYVISLFYAKAGLSIGMFALLILGVVSMKSDWAGVVSSFFKNKAYWPLLLVFLVSVLSGINSYDQDMWLKDVRIKLPFLLLPIAFYGIKQIRRDAHQKLHLVLGLVALLSTLPVLYHYFGNQADLVDGIGKGHYIPTPIDHIHYSIILAYASASLLLISVMYHEYLSSLERYLSGIIAIFLALILHVLAVRTGLIILYVSLAFVMAYIIVKKKYYVIGGMGLVALLALPFIAYQLSPSLKKKVQYMVYDYQQYKDGKGNNYSDSERLMSYAIAVDLIKEKPLLGHGIGDLQDLMVTRHKEKYGIKDKYIFPHNQYLYIGSAMGIVGLLLFLFGITSPLLFSKRNAFLILIYIAMLSSFMVENTVQRAVSIAFFLLFIFWNMKIEEEPQTS